MSTTEILDELPKLSPAELQRVHLRIIELEDQREIEPSPELTAAIEVGLRSLAEEPPVEITDVRDKVARWAGRST